MGGKGQKNKLFYNILTVIFAVSIILVVVIILASNGGAFSPTTQPNPSTQPSRQPPAQPALSNQTGQPSDQPNPSSQPSDQPNQTELPISDQQLVGKWVANSGGYLNFNSTGQVTQGVLGDESGAFVYPYSINGTTLTTAYKEGKPLVATFTIEALQDGRMKLTLQYNGKSDIFFKK